MAATPCLTSQAAENISGTLLAFIRTPRIRRRVRLSLDVDQGLQTGDEGQIIAAGPQPSTEPDRFFLIEGDQGCEFSGNMQAWMRFCGSRAFTPGEATGKPTDGGYDVGLPASG